MQLEVNHLSFRYSKKSPWILKDASFKIDRGERVGLIGPSGCGKSTLSKVIAGTLKPNEGTILFQGKPLTCRGYNPIQMIYQHPEQAINPRWKMGDVLTEAWSPDEQTMKSLGIEKEWLSRWPVELSGGELQRFCVARMMGPKTEMIIADEMSTMLDAITQVQIWETLLQFVKKRDIPMLIVTHDRHLAERVCTSVIKFSEINHL